MSTYGRREGRLTPRERREVLERDSHVCQLGYPGCGYIATVVDHVVCLAAGGDRDDPANRQASCASCHRIKTERERLTGIQRKAAHRRSRLKLPQYCSRTQVRSGASGVGEGSRRVRIVALPA